MRFSLIKLRNAIIFSIIIYSIIGISGDTVSRRFEAAEKTAVPPPPQSISERFGIYNWNVNTTAFPDDGSTDRLNWGADMVAGMGASTIRIALPATDIYQVLAAGTTDLVEIAKTPAFDKLLRDPRFSTIMLTAYTLGDMAGNWSDGFTQSEYDAERDEIRRLGEYLLANPDFTGKTFILLNWEGDNAIIYHANKRSIWDAYTEWIRSRTEGVALARQQHPESGARIFSGLEFNTLTSFRTGLPCGTPVDDPVRTDPLQNRCVIDYVAPRVEVDYYSYSAWRSLDVKLDNPGQSLKARLKSDFEFALSLVRSSRPGVGPENFILGEFGFERARYGECNAANYVNEVFDAVLDPDGFPVSYAVFWQIMDNAPFLGVGVEYFGLYRYRDEQFSLTLPGEAFKDRISGDPAQNYSGCPEIRRAPPDWGVLNSVGTTDFQLNPDSVISIYVKNCCQSTDNPFSAAGNTVHFNQTSKHFELPLDNGLHFYESQTQINFSMPGERRPGQARVYVTDDRGIDTNSQTIHVQCGDCPRIDDPFGVLDAAFQTLQIEPGRRITIDGSNFSAAGNRVVIEQIDPGHDKLTWVLDGSQIISQSPARIEAILPEDLIEGLNASLIIVNADGLESNDLVFTASAPCHPCGPRLKPFQAINSQDNSLFLPGSAVGILGRFDMTEGLSVVIEQNDSDFNLLRTIVSGQDAGSSAAGTEVRFNLPWTLFPGRALMYVVDGTGRESRAQEVEIEPGNVTTVSSATFKGSSVAPDSIASAFGSPLAPLTEAAQSVPLPSEIGRARVLIRDSAGKEIFAPLFFVSPAQINFHVPAELATGPVSLSFINGYGSASFGEVVLSPVAPGLYSANSDGKGVVAGVVLRITQAGDQIFLPIVAFDPASGRLEPIPVDTAASEDQIFLIIFGTGIRSAGASTTASIGGVPVEVTYSGPQNLFVGLDQINLRLPAGPTGDAEIRLSASGAEANRVTIRLK